MGLIGQAKRRVMKKSRAAKLAHFYSMFGPQDTVLDVGVSPERRSGPPARNYFLKTYRYSDANYTGLGVQDLSGMSSLFPGKSFVQYSGGRMPFSNNAFDWTFSNAVVEHVGEELDQLNFINELMRVGKRTFFTTPNKYFPVESHTNYICLHWNEQVFYKVCSVQKPWVHRKSLLLLSYSSLSDLMRRSNATTFRIFRNCTWGLTMTFTVIAKSG